MNPSAPAKPLLDVTILIPTWNGRSLLDQFLPSVLAAAEQYLSETKAQVEVLIIDDGSTDDTIAWLRENGFSDLASSGLPQPLKGEENKAPQLALHFVSNSRNLGFGETCNHGFQVACHRLVWLLNNDVRVDRLALTPLAKHFTAPCVFAVHCRVFELETGVECGAGKIGSFARGFLRVHQGYRVSSEHKAGENPRTREPLYSIFASGGSAMFDRDAFLGLGGFDSLLSPFYWEDVDLSYRAWKGGMMVLYEPDSIVYHRVSSTIRKLNQRRVRMIEQRNRLIYHWVNLHDGKLLLSHLVRVFFLALTAPLRLQPLFLLSVLKALKQLPRIRARRKAEKIRAKRSDREVLAIFQTLAQRDDVSVEGK